MSEDFYSQAQKMKERLNKTSPSFCLAKWLQLSLHLPTGRTHSCYHPPSHKVPLEEIAKNVSALHNTQHKKEQRKLMLEGKRPAECAYCWKVEDLKGNHLSDRHYRSTETWAAERFEEVAQAPWDMDIHPAYLEVNFNHACQFKCSYCSPQLSSSWMAEVKKEGHFPTIWGHNRLDWLTSQDLIPISITEENPYVTAFWKWWPEVYPHLRVFRMTGGEPLIDENTFKVFEYVKKHPNPQLSLSMTSNMCPPEAAFARFLKSSKEMVEKNNIKEFFLYASLDSVGAQAEYIRNGLDFSRFSKNVEDYLETVPGSQISFILTFNNLSVVGFKKYLEYMMSLRKKYSKDVQRVNFDTPFLRAPEFLSLQILSAAEKNILKETIEWAKTKKQKSAEDLIGLTDMEIAKMERVLEWVMQEVPEKKLSHYRTDFYLFFTEHDRRRKTNFLKTFPEMESFWNTCRKTAQFFSSQ